MAKQVEEMRRGGQALPPAIPLQLQDHWAAAWGSLSPLQRGCGPQVPCALCPDLIQG